MMPMVSLMAPLHFVSQDNQIDMSHDFPAIMPLPLASSINGHIVMYMTKTTMPLIAIYKPHMLLSSYAHDHFMSVYMPPVNPLQSSM